MVFNVSTVSLLKSLSCEYELRSNSVFSAINAYVKIRK